MSVFDPYYTWLGIPPEDQPADYYRLFGVKRFETNLEVISHAADKQMMHLRSFQAGQHAQASQKLLNELAAIRVCLLTPEKKAAYDEQLRLRTSSAQADVESSRSSIGAAGKTPTEKLPRALPLEAGTPAPPARARSQTTAAVVPVVGDQAPSESDNAGAERLPVWVFAAGGVGVLVVAVLALLMLRGSNAVQPVAQGNPNSAGVDSKPSSQEDDITTPGSAEEKAQPTTVATETPSPSASPQPPVSDVVPTATPATESNPKGSSPTSTPASGNADDAKDPASPANADSPAEKPAQPETNTRPEPPAGTDPAASTVVAGESPAAGETSGGNESGATENSHKETAAVGPEASAEKKLPAPAAAEITRAESLVKEIFAEDLAAAKSAQQRGDLAAKMIQSADGTDPQEAARYVLLMQASDLAAQAGNGRLIENACDRLAETYDVDVFKLKGRAFSDASKVNLDVQASGELCEQVLALANEAADAQRFDLTQPLVKLAQIFARKVKDKDLFKRINAESDRLSSLQSDFQAAESAAKRLADDPNDPAANLAYGKYLALSQHDWAQALPLLAKSGNAQVKAAAAADLAEPATDTDQVNLADAWYTVASGDKSLQGFMGRAHYWYELALPTLSGLTKTRVEKRLEETDEFASSSTGSAGKMGPITAKPRLTIAAHTSHVSALAFSPNSRMIASGSLAKDIKLWDASTGEAIKTLPSADNINSLIFSPDGKTLISTAGDYMGRFWTIPGGQMQHEIKDCFGVSATEDGKALAVYNPHTATTTLWDAASVRQTVALEQAPRCGVPCLSRDGKLLAAAGEEAVYVWNTQTGRVIYKLPTKASGIVMSPDGKLLVSTTPAGQLTIWNLITGAEKHSMRGDNDYVMGMAFSPDGGTLVTGGAAKRLRFWDPQSGELRVDVPDEDGYIKSLAFSPNGKMICTGSFSSRITLWDVEKLSAPAGGDAKK